MDTYRDLDHFLAQPRLGGLTLSPDGRRLVVGVTTPAPDGTRMRTCLWELDPDGDRPPRQLTRSAPGESAPRFLPDGDLLFLSARPDPDAAAADGEPRPALWRLPAAGGEPVLVLAPDAGVAGFEVASTTGAVVVHAEVFPDTDDLSADAARGAARREAEVEAVLLERYPATFWDRWLGPREPGRWLLGPPDDADRRAADDAAGAVPRLVLRGPQLLEASGALTPDARSYVTGWMSTPAGSRTASLVHDLVVIDLTTGQRRTLLADGRSVQQLAVSPDGTHVAVVLADEGDPERVAEVTLALVELATGELTDLTATLDLWPSAPRWLPDGSAVLFTADELGHRPLFRVEVAGGEVTRLTRSGAISDVCVAPDSRTIIALHAEIGVPHHPVRLAADEPDQAPVVLPSPAPPAPTWSQVHRVATTVDDGTEVGGWLVTPDAPAEADPVPLVTLIHGGPLSSWNDWHWRWNPHVLTANGYAVLLPDPALSTGYGRGFIARGWGAWAGAPASDVLALTEVAAARPGIDADRLAAAGGSFGGYLANLLAGTTDRFRGIVTHASLWSLRAFHGTTDVGVHWEREFGDPYRDPSRYEAASPDAHVSAITTPMLVVHGERDLRVPISEAMALWTDLARHDVPARLLYLPDEHHWVLKPRNARLWYQTVLAFLAETLRDEPFRAPELL